MKRSRAAAALFALALAGCQAMAPQGPKKPRLCLFVGFDVSGSFLKGPHYDGAVDFLAHYIHSHMNGLGGLEVPDALFVASIGGNKNDEEAKTFFPKQTFEGKTPGQIAGQLRELFPKDKKDGYTDFNAFFQQVAATVRNRNLVLRPITVVMFSDGVPAAGSDPRKADFKAVKIEPLENLSRNVVVRLLFTDPVTGKRWQNDVSRRRVKIWTQDAAVMAYWKDPNVMIPGAPLPEQEKFFAWVKDNVDFPVRAKRVD